MTSLETPALDTPLAAVSAELYFQIQQFYSVQMRLLDTGQAEAWADTFTEDGVFHQSVAPALRGRHDIAVAARRRIDQLVTEGRTRRHWFGMLEVHLEDDGVVGTSYYGIAMATPAGGQLQIYASTEATDSLVFADGRWLVRHRWVSHDATV
ncbi:nuclear transport factor 2 family protein [Catellatospora tritici]|uniref:nuclear transport factor 2 family protein n=1 Tax=Catellatospora tritici TaxID=2851566 RepID=UPI001C2D2EA7|nr:nuclear transport factor 2 family protein [Catellatospora tritici]MBV1855592.1 nuclear transport factor 2 family protein [Catellatospora tritici]